MATLSNVYPVVIEAIIDVDMLLNEPVPLFRELIGEVIEHGLGMSGCDPNLPE